MTSPADPATPADRPRWRRIIGSTWFHLIAAFVVTGLLLTFVAKPYVVPSASMTDTLQVGDRVLVSRLAYVAAEPTNGDVIVFDAGPTWDLSEREEEPPLKAFVRWVGEVTGFGPSGRHTLVKRIIGLPGQKVECCSVDGRILIDGKPIDEQYVHNDFAFEPRVQDCQSMPASPRCFDAVVVPENSYLMLGDNRTNSSDSAAQCRSPGADDGCWRWATRDEIVGRTEVILWPISRWSMLDQG